MIQERIPAHLRPAVQQVITLSTEFEKKSDSELHAMVEDIRGRWRGKMHDLWGLHQQYVLRGERSLDDWDPADGLYSQEDLLALCALVREVSWRRLHMRHYDVQIAAGLALIAESFVEMKTGEGKTIVALLPAVVFGVISQLDWEVLYGSSPEVARRSVHVITANRYLSQRDALEMQTVYEFFDLSVDVLASDFQQLDKHIAYKCDIIYGTVSEFGFDYLRDHIVQRAGDKQQGRLYCAVVDEVDHILVDEGTTPLILSKEDPEYAEVQRRTVYLFSEFAQQLFDAPQIFARNEDKGLYLTPLGTKAISVLMEEFHAEPRGRAENAALEPTARLAIQLCRQVLALAAGNPASQGEILVEPSSEGVRLTPVARAQLREITEEWGRADMTAYSPLVPAFFRSLTGILRATVVLRQLVGLTREEVHAMRRVIASLLRVGHRSRRNPSALLERPLENFLDELLTALRQGDPEEFRRNLGLLLATARKAGLVGQHPDWLALAAELETREPPEFRCFGADLQRYWLSPITRATAAALAGMPAENQRGYLALLRVLGALFTSGHLDPIMNRRLTSLQSYLKDFLFYPTLYTYWELGQHTQINEFGRALLRDFLRQVLTFDIWPDRRVEPGETLEEAVLRLYPEAESILRRALFAFIFRRRDVHYIVQKGEVCLVSEYTGFLEPQRRYSDLLHLFLERKERVAVRRRQKTVGRISIQRLVMLYKRLAGMSATAAFAQEEFQKIYGVDVIVIPPNRSAVEVLAVGKSHELLRDEAVSYVASKEDLGSAIEAVTAHLASKRPLTVFAKEASLIDLLLGQVRLEIPRFDYVRTQVPNLQRLDDLVYMTEAEKLKAAAGIVAERSGGGQPVLVGAPSIEVAEKFAKVLAREHPGLEFTPLNARPEHAKREAEIIARAGQQGRVTVATQMAGRGVDILVRPEIVGHGGLFVLVLERRESRRWDEQILGRSARQGDLGYGQFVLSFDDHLMQIFGSSKITGLMEKLGMEEGEAVSHPMVTNAVRRAQTRIEERKYLSRMITLGTDEELSLIRAELYELRNQTLAASHQCRGWPHGSATMLLEIRDPHCICKICRDSQPDLETGDSIVLLREGTQRVLAAGLDECLAPVQLENLLIETYASESALVEHWDWEGLMRDLSDYLGRKVARSEICRSPGMAERLSRASARKRFVPKAFYDWLEGRSDPQAAAYVNPRNVQTPWVERDVLRERLRSLLDEHLASQLIEQLVEEAVQKTAGADFKAAAVYWQLFDLMAHELPESRLGSLNEFERRVKDRTSLEQFLRERLLKHYRADAAVGREREGPQKVVTRLARFLRVFGVLRHEVENRVDAEAGSGPKFGGLREWAMKRVLSAYRTMLQDLGKTKLYRLENDALRLAIDLHFHRFLDNYDVYVTSGGDEHLEDSIREARLKIRKAWSHLRGNIAQSFVDNLAAQLENPPEAAGKPARVGAEGLLPDGLADCNCASSLAFHRCCGAGLYEVLR